MAQAQPTETRAASRPDTKWWNDAKWRGVIYQVALLVGVAALGWFLIYNTLENLASRHIATGFSFLGREASFDISESPIAFEASNTFARAFLVGLLNTFRAAIAGIILATFLGIVMGVARLSQNWLIRKLATVYVETIRSIPLLLQLFLWYELVTNALPQAKQAFSFFDIAFLSNRGLRLPGPAWDNGWTTVTVALLLGIAVSLVLAERSRKRQIATGHPYHMGIIVPALVIGVPVLAFLASGAHLPVEVPELTGFDFAGGVALSPEFAALLFGLVVYTGAFIAEIVRSGILAVPKGQTEAALSVNLTRSQALRLVILPQAMRVVTPPLTSQYLNLTKNSTLAVAIGYPDLVNIATTTINQTGQAVEGVTLMMTIYLVISLVLSGVMNAYNKRVALKGGQR